MGRNKIILFIMIGIALGAGGSWLVRWRFPMTSLFSVSSEGIKDGYLDPEYFCTGSALTPSFNFENIPKKAQSIALLAYRPSLLPKDPSLWIAYDFSTRVTHIPEGLLGGQFGNNLQGRAAVMKPCPKSGESAKYSIAAYALPQEHPFSSPPDFAVFMEYVTRESLAVASLPMTAARP